MKIKTAVCLLPLLALAGCGEKIRRRRATELTIWLHL